MKNWYLEQDDVEQNKFTLHTYNRTLGRHHPVMSITPNRRLVHTIKDLRELRDMITEFLGE